MPPIAVVALPAAVGARRRHRRVRRADARRADRIEFVRPREHQDQPPHHRRVHRVTADAAEDLLADEDRQDDPEDQHPQRNAGRTEEDHHESHQHAVSVGRLVGLAHQHLAEVLGQQPDAHPQHDQAEDASEPERSRVHAHLPGSHLEQRPQRSERAGHLDVARAEAVGDRPRQRGGQEREEEAEVHPEEARIRAPVRRGPDRESRRLSAHADASSSSLARRMYCMSGRRAVQTLAQRPHSKH